MKQHHPSMMEETTHVPVYFKSSSAVSEDDLKVEFVCFQGGDWITTGSKSPKVW